MLSSGPNLGRRAFLAGASGLFVSFALLDPRRALAAGADFASPDAGRLYAWLAIRPDNTASFYTGKVETGTGVMTALGQIAAEELDFPFDRLEVVMGTTSQTVDQGPSYGSLTVRLGGPQVRAAAAAGRRALLDLAAERFGVAAAQLAADDGRIHAPDGRSLSYGELVGGQRLDIEIGATGENFAMKVAPDAPLKDPKTYKVVGQSLPRKDIPGKVTGRFTYVQDVRVPGMLHGRVVRPYGYQATLVSVDEAGLKELPGFVQLVRRGNFLGVVAETEWAAIRAAELLGSTLSPAGPADGGATWSDWEGLPAQDDIWAVLKQTCSKDEQVGKEGDVDAALGKAARRLRATYRTPFQLHGSIGPSCAIADVRADRAIFWSGTQMPHQARRDMAKLLGIPKEKIELNWVEASGAYGRNGLEHVVADAALMSQAVGRPVRVQWMRWDEHGWEPKGPPILSELEGALDADNKVVAWRHHMWVPTTGDTRLIAVELAGLPEIGREGTGNDGAIHYAYDFPNADVLFHAEGRVGFLTAWLRAPAQVELTFAMESFIDELAAAAGECPLKFRLDHVTDDRGLDVLRAAARLYGWECRPSPAPAQTGNVVQGRGLAWVHREGTRVATIVDLSVDKASGEIAIKRVVVAHDCGLVVTPDGVKNQIEGNIIQSLSRALHEEMTFDRARVTSREWGAYPILRFHEIPDSIDIILVNNRPDLPAGGAGEPSSCATFAAVSNAIFDATGVRLRQTPFRPERVKAALA